LDRLFKSEPKLLASGKVSRIHRVAVDCRKCGEPSNRIDQIRGCMKPIPVFRFLVLGLILIVETAAQPYCMRDCQAYIFFIL
jgi:hypothetical protein